ncbi:hypothetical protein [Parasitella parasitica]|uniref:Reverse transcriptase domain-containing protein n=1 Tax=Parasitella parasitica TaxID=35722 RepID=A0A0B7NQE7_9FUNG|nr:hypothetical protein [Parasitella parasitica]
MEDLLDKLHGSTWYHCIDLNTAYFQIPIFQDHKCKTGFSSSNGLWDCNSLAQGLCNSPATFARYMENMLSSVQAYTIKHLDDILCHADTKKCQFLQQEVRYLGFIISGSGVKSNPDKILPIKTWKAPKTTQKLMQFLEICTSYHKFVRNLAGTAAPLCRLLKKDTPFIWTTKYEDAFFQALKDALIQIP